MRLPGCFKSQHFLCFSSYRSGTISPERSLLIMASTIAARPLSPVLSTVSAALRRHYLALVLEQLPWALTAFFSGLALLLVLGTRYLHPLWLLLFAVGGIALAAVRIYGRRTNSYGVAQLLDDRLQLHDSLSTAWHILVSPPLRLPEPGRCRSNPPKRLRNQSTPVRPSRSTFVACGFSRLS